MMDKYFTHENIDKFERLINLIKPKFYNKLTWFVVGAGLAVISKPIWVEVLNVLLEKNYQLNITEGNDSILGFALVVIALVYNLITVYFDKFLIAKEKTIKEEKESKKDSELFSKFLNELPSNGSIEFLRTHSFENSFYLKELREISNFQEKWDNAEHEFIDDKLELLRKQLLEDIKIFRHSNAMGSYSMGNGYFTTTPDAYRMDEWNIPKHVIDKMKEMNTFADKVCDTHQELIRIAKKTLN